MDFSVVEDELHDASGILAGFCRRIISKAKWAVSTMSFTLLVLSFTNLKRRLRAGKAELQFPRIQDMRR